MGHELSIRLRELRLRTAGKAPCHATRSKGLARVLGCRFVGDVGYRPSIDRRVVAGADPDAPDRDHDRIDRAG